MAGNTLTWRASLPAQAQGPSCRLDLLANEVPANPDVVAWNRARTRNRLELLSAIAAGLFITGLFFAFARILQS